MVIYKMPRKVRSGRKTMRKNTMRKNTMRRKTMRKKKNTYRRKTMRRKTMRRQNRMRGGGHGAEEEKRNQRIRERETERLEREKVVEEDMVAKENEKDAFNDALKTGVLTKNQVSDLAWNIYQHEEMVNNLNAVRSQPGAGTAYSVRNELIHASESLSILNRYWDNAYNKSPVMRSESYEYKDWIPDMYEIIERKKIAQEAAK